MINMEERHLKILLSILKKVDYEFYIFGSRITKNAKKFSDVDIFYFENIPQKILFQLEEDFEESDLPYKVDLVNYNHCSDDFKKIMSSNMVRVSKK